MIIVAFELSQGDDVRILVFFVHNNNDDDNNNNDNDYLFIIFDKQKN